MSSNYVMQNDGIQLRLETLNDGNLYIPCSTAVDITSSGVVINGPCAITYLAIHTSTSTGSILIQDNTSTPQTIFRFNTVANEGTEVITFSSPLIITTGVLVTLSNATVTIGYFE